MNDNTLGLGEPPWIVGHRGAAGEAPENTLDSFLLALDQGADMIECDLQMTADGELVACHDWTLERMGGVATTVEEAAFDDIDRIDVSGPFRRPGLSRVLATLDEILTMIPSATPLNVELKRQRADPGDFARLLASMLEERARVLVSSFDWDLLSAVRAEMPSVPLAPLGGRQTDPAELLVMGDRLAAWSIHCRQTLAEPQLVSAAAAAGRPVFVYTVNEVDAARRLFERGVQGVFSDFPGRLRQELGARQ